MKTIRASMRAYHDNLEGLCDKFISGVGSHRGVKNNFRKFSSQLQKHFVFEELHLFPLIHKCLVISKDSGPMLSIYRDVRYPIY